MWQTLERKARFISQVMRNDAVARDVDDVDDSVLSFAEVKALASGNPLILEQAGVQSDLAKYERLQFAHDEEQRQMAAGVERHHASAAAARLRVEVIEQAIAQRQDTSGDRFAIVVDSKTYDRRPEAATVLRAKAEDVFADLVNPPGADWKVDHGEIGELGGFRISLRGYRIDVTKEAVFRIEIPNLRPEREVKITVDEMANNVNIVQRLEALLRKLDRDLTTEQEQAEERAAKETLMKHYAKRRKSADIKAAEHLGRLVHGRSDEPGRDRPGPYL